MSVLEAYLSSQSVPNRLVMFATDSSKETATIRRTWDALKIAYNDTIFEEFDFETFKTNFNNFGIVTAPGFVFIRDSTLSFALNIPTSAQLQQAFVSWG